MPAQQDLDTGYPAAGGRDLRLVMKVQFPPLQGVAQVRLELHSFHQALVEGLGEKTILPPPLVLGLVHGGIRLLQQVVDVARVVGADGDADARADRDLPPLHVERHRELLLHALRQPAGAHDDVLAVLLHVDDDHELVPDLVDEDVGGDVLRLAVAVGAAGARLQPLIGLTSSAHAIRETCQRGAPRDA